MLKALEVISYISIHNNQMFESLQFYYYESIDIQKRIKPERLSVIRILV